MGQQGAASTLNMPSQSAYRKGVVQAILAGAFLSTAGIGMRLLDGATPMQVTFYRALGLSVLMLLVLAVRSGGKPWKLIRITDRISIVAGVFFAAASWTLIFAIAYTTVANVMFIVSLAPFFSALLAWLVLRERVTTRTWIAISVAVVGVLVMVSGGLANQGLKGVLYAFAMAIFYAGFSVTARVGKNQDMLPAAFWAGIFLAVACGIQLDSFAVTTKDATISVALGVFQVGLGGLLILSAAKSVPAAQLVFLAMLEVVLSPIWVWLGVGEKPAATSIFGGVIIMAAIAYQALGQQDPTSSHQASLTDVD